MKNTLVRRAVQGSVFAELAEQMTGTADLQHLG
jgi:ribosomal protein L10